MKTYRNCILLFLFCLFLYGTFSGLIPLLDPDEPVYGETAKEMLAKNWDKKTWSAYFRIT